MKQLILAIILAVFLFSPSFVFATYDESETKNDYPPVATATPTLITEDNVEYELIYPGILPDNPLYIFKVARDRVVGGLITDPLKKAEYFLHNSDKRFYAGMFLVTNNKEALAVSTISKGNNYFEESLKAVEKAKKEKKDVNPLIDKMVLASKKHSYVIKDLQKEIDKSNRGGLDKEYTRSQEIEKKVALLKTTKKK